jgi:hypothetical protein
MTGYEDLDEYGIWRYVANYGYVWAPTRLVVGWAPYRYGHWAWIAPWGWTWVDDAPWGFAPFHYGRWACVGTSWFWVPGPITVRPVYAPALVAFVGGGGFQFSASFGGGPGVAWFPLAPGEVFVPMYHTSRVYVNNINTTNTVVRVSRVTEVYNNSNAGARVTYANQHAIGVTAVSQEAFVNARPVSRNIVQLPPRDIEQAPVSHLTPATPIRNSALGAGTPAPFHPPSPVATRPVVANRIPPAAPRSFSSIESERMREGNNGAVTVPAPGNSRPIPRPVQPVDNARTAGVTGNSHFPETTRSGNPPPAAAHPLVRPAAPAQPKTQQQLQEEESKNRNWQQQRTTTAPRQNAPRTEQRSSEGKEKMK